jgi:uncharacterized protein (UPF0548 family)
MTVDELAADHAATLRRAPFTYEPVGATKVGRQDEYNWLEQRTTLTRRDFDGAANDLFTWNLHSNAGLRVQASESPLIPGTVVLMHFGLGKASLRIPCRVVYVIDEPRRRGFAYGTLPGHPESGEESFVLEQHGDGTITISITAFSRPASRMAKLGGPISRKLQQAMTARYLRALDRT